MINKELIQGIAIGALRVEKCNIEKVTWTACGITSHNDGELLRLTLEYNCNYYLKDIEECERILNSFCNIQDIVVGKNIDIYIVDKHFEGEE